MKTFEAGEHTQTRFFVFITEKGIPFRPIKGSDDDGHFHPAFKFATEFTTEEEATSFYLDVLKFSDSVSTYRGVCKQYLEESKKNFIEKEFLYFKNTKKTENYSGLFISPCEDTGCELFLNFHNKEKSGKNYGVEHIFNIIF